MSPTELPSRWRELGKLFRSHADESLARAYELCAEELEEALQEEEERILTLREASEIGGYSVEHLGRWVRKKKIPNAGRPGAPRIRVGDLPKKKGHLRSGGLPGYNQVTKEQIVRSAIKEA